jgi:hypothetical protein
VRNSFIRLRDEWLELHHSDEHCVASVRKQVAITEHWRWWLVGGVFAYAILLSAVCEPLLKRFLSMMPVGTKLSLDFGLGFGMGVVTGGLLMLPILVFPFMLFAAFNPLRTERLLLKYHDALRELERSRAGDAVPHT